MSNASSDIKIIYQDKHLIACNKPAGILSVPGRGIDKQDSVYKRLQETHTNLRIVHRLDMATSGIMLFSLNGFCEKALHQQFRQRQVAKRYCALVYRQSDGQKIKKECQQQRQGSIEFPLTADWHNRPKQKVCYQHGKPSQTFWRLCISKQLSQGCASMISLRPITGRSHQLRVHLAESGWPIIGDNLYNKTGFLLANRTMLHACSLRYRHPITGKTMLLRSPLPESMKSYWRSLSN